MKPPEKDDAPYAREVQIAPEATPAYSPATCALPFSEAAPRRGLFEIMSPWALLFLGLVCMILYQVITFAFWSTGHQRFGLLVAPVAGVLVPLWIVTRRLGLRTRQEFGLRALTTGTVARTVWILISALPLSYALNALNSHLFPPQPEQLDFYRSLVPHDLPTFCSGFLAVVVVAPLAEEMIFRGLVLGVSLRHLPAPLAIVLTGVLFGAAHGAPWLLFPITFLGILLGAVTYLTRSLSAAWVGHAFFNLAAYLEMSITGDVSGSRLEEWSLDPLVCVASLAALGAGLVSLARQRPSNT